MPLFAFPAYFSPPNRVPFPGPSEQGSNKSATIEMYAPSSYNETVTGETLSSVSEKSENYSNAEINEDYTVGHSLSSSRGPSACSFRLPADPPRLIFIVFSSFQEDGCKVATSTYLIDQIDYPFQYPAAYEMQQQMKANHAVPDPEVVQQRNTLPHNTISKGNYVGNSILPPPTIDGAYYNLQPDSRWVFFTASSLISPVALTAFSLSGIFLIHSRWIIIIQCPPVTVPCGVREDLFSRT